MLLRSLLTLTLCSGLLASVPSTSEAIEWPSLFGSERGAEVGTATWWKANKKRAVFVPGNGYQVPGVEGYFDIKGRPIDAPVDEVITSLTDPIQEEKGLLPGIDPKKNYKELKQAVGYGVNESAGKTALARGNEAYAKKQYASAASLFRAAANRWPSSAIESEALFKLAESHFFQDNYVDARDAYNELVTKHANTPNLDTLIKRQWEIARYWEKHHMEYKQAWTLQPNFLDKTRPTFDTLGQAVKTYESIRLNDPTGPRADDSIMATAGIYFREGRFNDADYHYSLLRTEYPRSEFQFDAHILGLQSKLKKYQGPDYDGTPLEEAEKLLKQIRTRFAGRLTSEEKDRLREAQAQVEMASDERLLKMGQYYEGTEHFGAARHYYAELARKNPNSPGGKIATERLASFGGRPAVPEEKLAWFVDLFPENRERARVARIPELSGKGDTRLATKPRDDSNVQPASATTTR